MNTSKFEKKLQDLERTLTAQTERALGDARESFIDTAHDLGDAGNATESAENHFTQAEIDSGVLQQVRDALARIAAGTFGKCIVDGGPIEAKRLEAVPWTPYCLEHQGLIEASAPPRTT
jgi:DnaK suppressor protein